MYEEQSLPAAGVPFSKAHPMCSAVRREIAMSRITEDCVEKHPCKCGGAGNCPDCPNRNR